jgi:RNA polymerase sigma factor (sigma-70 family)
MCDYCALSDEQLVQAYQTSNDGLAVAELVERYQPFLIRKAEQVARKSPFISVNDFHSAFLDKLWKAAVKFNPAVQMSNGKPATFGAYLRMKLATAAYDLIRRDPQTVAQTNGVTISYFSSYQTSGQQDDLNGTPDIKAFEGTEVVEGSTIEKGIKESATDLFQYIESQSVQDAQVLLLRSQGYTGEEIARRCGRQGNRAALGMWTKRAIERLQGYTVTFYDLCGATHEIGSYVS